MPFRLKNAAATYQRLVNEMFQGQIGQNVEVYMDDMLVKSLQIEQHLSNLDEIFHTLRKYKMKLNPSKCTFGVSAEKFLRFMVSQRGIEANLEKVKAILGMQAPRNTKEVQCLVDRITTLSHFISHSTDKCSPFFRLLRKAFHWDDECDRTFDELKNYLSRLPVIN